MKGIILKNYDEEFNGTFYEEIEEEKATLGEKDVLIKVKYFGINPIDVAVHTGKVKDFLPINLPSVVGQEVSGVVVEIGSKVTEFFVHDEVTALIGVGGKEKGMWKEFAQVKEEFVAKKPISLNWEQAMSLAQLTAYQMLTRYGQCKEGDRVFIHGGSGSVGSACVQIAKAFGANVTATCSTKNVEFVESLGADKVHDYRKETVTEIYKEREFDYVLDCAHGNLVDNSTHMVKPKGKLIYISGVPDRKTLLELGMNPVVSFLGGVFPKLGCHVSSSFNDYRFKFLGLRAGVQLREYNELVDKHNFQMRIDKIYHAKNIRKALLHQKKGPAGKIVVAFGEEDAFDDDDDEVENVEEQQHQEEEEEQPKEEEEEEQQPKEEQEEEEQPKEEEEQPKEEEEQPIEEEEEEQPKEEKEEQQEEPKEESKEEEQQEENNEQVEQEVDQEE